MSDVTAEATIDAPAEAVWTVLADEYDRLHQWFSGASETEMATAGPLGVGSIRVVCTGPVRVREEIVDWEPVRRLRYTIAGMGPGVRDVRSEWLLHPRPDGSTVAQVRTSFEMRGGAFGIVIRPVYAQVLLKAGRDLTAGLKAAVEARAAES